MCDAPPVPPLPADQPVAPALVICGPAPITVALPAAAATSDAAGESTGPAAGLAQDAASSTPAATGSAPASDLLAEHVIAPLVENSGGDPFSPEPAPPAPATAIGGAGCGTHGAGPGAQKGASAAAAGVLGSSAEISFAVNDAGLTEPAAGSPTTTATDPGTRPD